MSARRPPRLLDLSEGIAVAGTHDLHAAVQLATCHDSFEDYDREISDEDLIEVVAELAERLHGMLTEAREDWWRVIPAMRGECMCGDGHAWDFYPAKAESRGAFRVVWWS